MTYIADVQCMVVFITKMVIDCHNCYDEPTEEEIIKELEKSKHLSPVSDHVSTWELFSKSYEVTRMRAQEPDIVVYRGT